jgi:hypothetical protein
LVQTKGWQRSFQPSMKVRILALSSFTVAATLIAPETVAPLVGAVKRSSHSCPVVKRGLCRSRLRIYASHYPRIKALTA